MIEVFKTNVTLMEDAATILLMLFRLLPSCKINFDLEDCDKILRVEGESFIPKDIIKTLHTNGYTCEALED